MTPDPLCAVCLGRVCVHGEQSDPELRELDDRVAAAVKAEREACAKVAERWIGRKGQPAVDIVAAIRARGAT